MELIQQAVDFRQTFCQPFSSEISDKEKHCDMLEFQSSLIEEESDELVDAAFRLLNFNGENSTELKSNLLKEMADVVFVVYQLAAYMGWNLDEAMKRVYESNMTKLDANGRPIFNEKGKVMKGPNYVPPSLEDLV